MEFLLQQQWYDPRLRYSNRSQYEYLNAIHHYDDIWLPDTYFIMHGDFKDPLIPVHFALRIYRNGTVNYLMRYLSPFSIASRCVSILKGNLDFTVIIWNSIFLIIRPSIALLRVRESFGLFIGRSRKIFPSTDIICRFSFQLSGRL